MGRSQVENSQPQCVRAHMLAANQRRVRSEKLVLLEVLLRVIPCVEPSWSSGLGGQ